MNIRPEEIASVLRQEIETFEYDLSMEEVGTVLEIGDGIARIFGLDNVMQGIHQRQDLFAPLQISAGELANDVRMRFDLTVLQVLRETGISTTQVIDPYRRIDQH